MSDSWTAVERLAFYRQQDAARAAFDAMRCAALAGNEAKAAAVRENWEPIRRYQQESRNAREEPTSSSPCRELVN
jgi:hypothetical protein